MKYKKQFTVTGLIIVSLTFAFIAIRWPANIAAANISAPSTTAATLPTPDGSTFPLLADFEGGVPADWFVYGDFGNGVTIDTAVVTISDTDGYALPGQIGNNDILSVTANVPTWGGFGANLVSLPDGSDYDGVRFWFYGTDSGALYAFEIQEIVNASQVNWRASFTDDFVGWQQIVLPFSTFTGGAGVPQLTQIQAWVFILDGTIGSFKFDHLALTNLLPFADFEGGVPTDWFVYGDFGNGVTIDTAVVTISDTDGYAIPGQVGNNDILSVTANVPTWGGFGANLVPMPDWSDYDGVSFWFYGSNSGQLYAFEIQEIANGGQVNWRATFTDVFTGWQQIVLPFTIFTGGAGTPTLTQMQAWVYVLDGSVGSFKLDGIGLYGDAGNITLKTAFANTLYTVGEGDTATITVTLNTTSTLPVTVTVASRDDTAMAGDDYTAVMSVPLVISPTTLTTSFVVTTIDDDEMEASETLTLTLSQPINAELGANRVAIVRILDNDQPTASGTGKGVIVDDIESGLPTGTEISSTAQIGWITWSDGSPIGIGELVVADDDPLARPGQPVTTTILEVVHTIGGFGGFTHAFENEAVDDWVTQDWSRYEGISFWFYGNATGEQIQFDLFDNRGTTDSDSAERFFYRFDDDTSGWKYVEILFSELERRTDFQPPGAPDDGLNLIEVHGYAIGFPPDNGVERTNYVDDVALIVRTEVIDDIENGLPNGQEVNSTAQVGWVTWSDGSPIGIGTLVVADDDPLARPGQPVTTTLLEVVHTIGGFGGFTHAFENETVDDWVTQNWSSYEGVCFWFYGNATGEQIQFDLFDNRGTTDSDSAERYFYRFDDDVAGWQFVQIPFTEFQRRTDFQPPGAPDDGLNLIEVHGYAVGFPPDNGVERTNYIDDVTIYGNIDGAELPLQARFEPAGEVVEGETAVITVSLTVTSTEPVTVSYDLRPGSVTPDRDFVGSDGQLVFAPGETAHTFTIETIDDGKHERTEQLPLFIASVVGADKGFPARVVLDVVDNDAADPGLVDDFEGFQPFAYSSGPVELSATELNEDDPLARPEQDTYEYVATATYSDDAAFHTIYSTPTDWSDYSRLQFWYYGTGSGETVTLALLENQTTTATLPTEGDDLSLVWSDEFNGAAGTPPDPDIWTHELGDYTPDGKAGWGNEELQYYTDSTDNAAMDGEGNLVITVTEFDETSELMCYYGPCQYGSARLITLNKIDFQYGRIEANIKVPSGGDGIDDGNGYDVGDGIWPAFWTLGNDIETIPWPTAGEIDIMEVVSREPYEVFGTIHGPGYSGGNSFGDTHVFTVPVYTEYHTFAIEWEPNEIRWYVDDIHYHTATPDDVLPNEWVYEHPFFLLLNVAVGGNFGGPVGDNVAFPQEMLVDYIRVYQMENKSERFTYDFVDDRAGWRQINFAFDEMIRSSEQPDGAPNDGLTLSEVWGYGFHVQGSGTIHLDAVKLTNSKLPIYTLFMPFLWHQ